MKLPPPPTSLRLLLSHAKVVWKHWDVQSMVLTSLITQLVLIFLAPFRKRTSNTVIVSSIWFAYLFADWVAIQSIGLISNPLTATSLDVDGELYAFWAQFLLLHLGGPDTITALALEDNELWLRTGLHLAVQIYGGLGILVKSVGHSHTSLWLPTMLMFTAGIFKYMERLSSLYYGRYHKLPLIHSLYTGEKCMQKDEVELLRDSFYFYMKYLWFYAGEKYTVYEAYTYMSLRTPEEAFRVLEIQFNLTYEALYTKTVLICTIWRWKALRHAVTLLEVGCLVIWLFFTDKEGFEEHNIRITYTLLIGAIAVDVLSFLKVHLCSDWAIALKVCLSTRWKEPVPRAYHLLPWFYHIILFRTRSWGRYKGWDDAPLWASFRRLLFRRWSESIPQLSALSLFMGEKPNKVLEFIGAGEGMKQGKYVSRKWFSDHLRDFLFQDIKDKAKTKGAGENIGKVKGSWACHGLMFKYQTEMISIPHICNLMHVRGEYYEILMRWHIVTELCYQGDQLSQHDLDAANPTCSGNRSNSVEEECNYRDICKTLSNYLIYLLIHRQDMMPFSRDANYKLRGTFDFVRQVLQEYLASNQFEEARSKSESLVWVLRHKLTDHEFHSTFLHNFHIDDILGELEELEKKHIGFRRWEFMAKVWSELLYYAAIQCKPNLHAVNLKQGGELLSFVWLLLAHMGFGLDESNKPAKDFLDESDFELFDDPP